MDDFSFLVLAGKLESDENIEAIVLPFQILRIRQSVLTGTLSCKVYL